MDLATKKMQKAMESLHRAISEYDKGMVREAKGSLDFVVENCQESIWLMIDEIKQKQNN